ncbi:MAG: hypothetical protein GSR80_000176 [Desulfurococcales archaeon]|nr:hypothetical protein [Desulfurococcales archaeon]
MERSVSRTGKHAATRIVVVVRASGRVEVYSRPTRQSVAAKTYSRGYAGAVDVDLGPGDVLVVVRLVRGPSGRVSGAFSVVDSEGREVLRAVYRRLKVRLSRGDPSYSWAVERAAAALGLDKYIRRYNWGR